MSTVKFLELSKGHHRNADAGAHYTMSMYDARTLGNNIMISRRDLAMTQEELAAAVGISRAYLTNIERGRGARVGIDIVFSLAAALGVTPQYLMGLSDNPLGEPNDGEYIAVDADTAEERQQLRRLIDDFTALSQRDRTVALSYLRMMRQIEDEETRVQHPPPRIIGA